MASSTRSNAFNLSIDSDPWDWSVEEVVAAICPEDSLLRRISGHQRLLDHTGFAKILREQDVSGSILLTQVDNACLRDDLGLRTVGSRGSVVLLIAHLRRRSSKYLDHVQGELGNSAVPGHGTLLDIGPGSRLGSPFQVSPQCTTPQAAPSLKRYLMEPINSPEKIGQIMRGPGELPGLGMSGLRSAMERQQDIPLEGPGLSRSTRHLSPLPMAPRDEYQTIRIDPLLPQEEGYHSADPTHSDHVENIGVENGGKALDNEDDNITGRRHGETYIVDDTGRKRRRLVLDASNTQKISTQPLLTASETLASHPCKLPEAPAQPATCMTFNQVATMGNETEGNTTPRLNEGPDPACSNGIESPPSSTKEMAQEPGRVVRDALGRKRMRPILVLHPDVDADLSPKHEGPDDEPGLPYEQHSPLNHKTKENLAHTESGMRRSKSHREARQIYLGLESLPVDRIFYGATALDEEIDHRLENSGARHVDLQGDLRTFQFMSDSIFGNGQRIYVYNRIKHFLHSAGVERFRRKRQVCPGVVPYSNRITKKHQTLSMTVFVRSPEIIKALRVDRLKWCKAKPRADALNSQDQQLTVGHGDSAQEDSLLLHLGENEIHDWDFLEKWNFKENANDLLPVYGDSGSEGEYDLDTWREIEQETGKLQRPSGVTKSKMLGSDEVNEAINEAMEQLAEDWKTKKLAQVEYKAWQIWTKSRRLKTKREQIGSLSQEIGRLDVRLAKLRKELISEVWSSVPQIKKQCNCMQQSIYDQELCKWKIGILELKNAPSKPPPSEKKLKVVRAQSQPDSLEEGEENLDSNETAGESSEEDWDDFIDDADMDQMNTEQGNLEDADVGEEGALETSTSVQMEDDSEENIVSPSARPSMQSADSGTIKAHSGIDGATTQNEEESDMAREAPGDKQNLPLDETKLFLSDSAKIGQSSLETSPSPVLIPDVIDLTQFSDSVHHQTQIQKAVEPFRIRTPPIDDDTDPFRRNRKVKVEFKTPPTLSNVVDLESSSSSSANENVEATPKKLPEIWEVSKIYKLRHKYLQERQDRKRLLVWIIAHVEPDERFRALAQTKGIPSAVYQVHVCAALKKMKGHGQKVRGYDHQDGNVLLRIAGWYVCWSQCIVASEKHGLQLKHIEAAIAETDGFKLFYDFMLECLKHYDPESTKKTITPHKKKQRLLLEDSDDYPAIDTESPHKRRKYVVPENIGAREVRIDAQERVRERDIRQRQLQSQLQKMGVNTEDPAKMIINVGKFEDQELILLNPKIGTRIQPHQLEGVQFMWRELVTDDNSLQGCLLAHTMGLGKTMQVITLLVTIAEAAKSDVENIRNQVPSSLQESRTIILCPPSLIENWWEEFLMWAPDPMVDNVGEIHKVTSSMKLVDRLYEIQEWSKTGGILLLGYSTFRDLVSNKAKTGKVDQATRPLNEEEHQSMLVALLEQPNIVVADEAHALKNQASGITKQTARFRTKSRIALTGSPLANNLEEYYSIINWIAPNYLGDSLDFRSKYIEPIQEGLWQDSSLADKRKSLKMLQVLKTDLDPKVHRADISILKGRLKSKTEFVVRIPLTNLQEQAYNIYVSYMLAASRDNEPGTARLWGWLSILRLLCNHPKCFRDKLVTRESDVPSKKMSRKSRGKKGNASVDDDPDASDIEALVDAPVSKLGISQGMVDDQMSLFASINEPLDSIALAHKIQILIQVLDFAEEAGDRTLVFSHSLQTLDYIEGLLRTSHRRYRRLDGKTQMSNRQQLTKDFNFGNINICLISTRAGGQGLNLFGANRVVIVDDHFNPIHEEQAIGRAYRIGQQKHVYVYRLTVGGTFEEALQNQSLFKRQLASRVVDKKNPTRHAMKGVRQYLFAPTALKQKDLSSFVGKDELVLDRILASQEDNSTIRSIDLSETFQQEDGEELTAEEKQEAEQLAKEASLRRSDPVAYQALKAKREMEEMRRQVYDINAPRLVVNKSYSSNFVSTGGVLNSAGSTGDMVQTSHHNGTGFSPNGTTGADSTTPNSGLPHLQPITASNTHMRRSSKSNDERLSHESVRLNEASPGRTGVFPMPVSKGIAQPENVSLSSLGSARKFRNTFAGVIEAASEQSHVPSKSRSSLARESAEMEIYTAIASELPNLVSSGLLTSACPDEVCRLAAKKLERRSNYAAVHDADYRHIVRSSIDDFVRNEVCLARFLIVVKRKFDDVNKRESLDTGIATGPSASDGPEERENSMKQPQAGGSIPKGSKFMSEDDVRNSIPVEGITGTELFEICKDRIRDAEEFVTWVTRHGQYNDQSRVLFPRRPTSPAL